jgi:hypothetical protein
MFPKLFSQDEKTNDRIWMAWLITLVVGLLGAMLGVQFPVPPLPIVEVSSQGVTNLDSLHLSGPLISFTDLTVSDGQTITPTYTVYALDTSGAVTITLAASAQEGQLLYLINDDANATLIADTNIRTSDGNAVTMAGAYDVTVWVYQDSEWLLLLAIANS